MSTIGPSIEIKPTVEEPRGEYDIDVSYTPHSWKEHAAYCAKCGTARNRDTELATCHLFYESKEILKTNVHVASQHGATDEYITDREEIQIEISYPIKDPVVFTARHEKGFTLRSFTAELLKGYIVIYKDPKKYGIWGHGIGDLYLERIEEQPTGLFHVSMGS